MKAHCFKCDPDVPCTMEVKDLNIRASDLKSCPFGYQDKHKWEICENKMRDIPIFPEGYFRRTKNGK